MSFHALFLSTLKLRVKVSAAEDGRIEKVLRSD